ncbi:DivIVA domain-containing protein [Nonomuraea sp. CA-143628]|uniref:DivIVA domain-containing protein n=1 Tax=Nonomuraea sp. CA-143628 TaxID=3239997 RepID=UPI003D8F6463
MHVEHEDHDHHPHLPHSHAVAADGTTTSPVQAAGPGQLALLTAAAVHHQVFTVVRLRAGYDLAEVDAFLAGVETTLSLLWQDNTHLRERLAAAASQNSRSTADVLAEAEQTGQETIRAARQEARQILAAAHAEAEQLQRQAAADADALTQATRLAYCEAIEAQVDQLGTVITDHSRQLQQSLHTQLEQLRTLLDDLTTPSHGAHEASSLPARSGPSSTRTHAGTTSAP